MTSSRPPLELDEAAMRALVQDTLGHLLPHVAGLEDQPASQMRGGRKLALSLVEELPEVGTGHKALLQLLFKRVIPPGIHTAHPGYLAYVPGGGLFQSAVADFIAMAVNRYVGVSLASPGLAQLERNVLRWFADLAGLPPSAGGVLTSGGSMANLVAIHTARANLLGDDFSTGTIYFSDEAHHSLPKAARITGFAPHALRTIPTDAHFRIRIDALKQAIADDRRAGRRPFLLVANAGSTNTGAVDDLVALSEVARAEGMWLHVDGAYGGFFLLTERGRLVLRGMEHADSITLDPHKGLFLPYGTGCVLVRDVQLLRKAHAHHAEYLPSTADDEAIDFADLSPELSREARGLRVWLPIKLHGAAAFRQALDEKLDLAKHAAEELARIPDLEMVNAPQLSLLAFRLRPAGMDQDGVDRLNRALLRAVNDRKRVMLSSTRVRGGVALRICVLSFRTHRRHVDAALTDISEAAAALR